MATQSELDRDFPVDQNSRDAQNGGDPNHPELIAIRAIADHWDRLNAEFAYFGIPEVGTPRANSNANKAR